METVGNLKYEGCPSPVGNSEQSGELSTGRQYP